MKAPEGLNIPIFMAVGDQDELFEIDAVKELFDEVPGNNKEFHIIKGAKHAQFPEVDISPDFQYELIRNLEKVEAWQERLEQKMIKETY